MDDQQKSRTSGIDRVVASYRETRDFPVFIAEIDAACSAADTETIVAAAEPYLDVPEIAGPLYERIVDRLPDDSRALVILASAYWLTGRGPDVVGELASRALIADASNRGAWHLWALTEGEPRRGMERWLQVSRRFPDDALARANLADNAASLAGAENDPVALSIAIESYESLLSAAREPDEQLAIQQALDTLRTWRL
jgi:hypothetical protein